MRVNAPISNYYGGPYVENDEGKFFLGIQDCTSPDERVEVSAEFARLWAKEFGNEIETENFAADDGMGENPPNYERIRELGGHRAKFTALYKGRRLEFEVLEHSNLGKGWTISNRELKIPISATAVSEIEPLK